MMRILAIFLAVAFFSGTVQAQNKTELLWLGQAGFRIKTPGSKVDFVLVTLAGFQAALQGSPYKVTPMTEGQTLEF